MKRTLSIIAAAMLLATSPIATNAKDKANDACSAGDYQVSLSDLYLGMITATEISIEAQGRSVCTDGIATGKNESGSQVVLEIEDGSLVCIQSGTEQRLAAAKATRELYYVRGQFVGISNGSITLKDCSLQHYTTL